MRPGKLVRVVAGSCAWGRNRRACLAHRTGTQERRRRHDHLPRRHHGQSRATRIAMAYAATPLVVQLVFNNQRSLNSERPRSVGDLAMLKPRTGQCPEVGDDGVAHGSATLSRGSSLTRPPDPGRLSSRCLAWSIGRLGRRSSRQAHQPLGERGLALRKPISRIEIVLHPGQADRTPG